MKTLTGLLAVLAVAFAWSSQARSPEKAVSDLEQQWAEAQKVGQVDIVAPMLADTFINTDAGGETYGKSKLREPQGWQVGSKRHQRCPSKNLRRRRRCDWIMEGQGRRRRWELSTRGTTPCRAAHYAGNFLVIDRLNYCLL